MNQMKCKVKKTKPHKWEFCDPDKQMESKQSIGGYLESLPAKLLAILRYFMGLGRRYSVMYVSQQRIADLIGISREYCCRLIGKLVKMGLLHKIKRFNMVDRIKGTCMYRLPSLFTYKYVQEALLVVFASFSFFNPSVAVGTLPISSLEASKTEEITLCNLSLKEFIKLPVLVPVLESNTYVARESSSMKFSQTERETGPIAPIITGPLTKLLNLTHAGQVRFAAFPDDVLREAILIYQKKTGINTPNVWLIQVCRKICEKQSIIPDWFYVDTLRGKLGFSRDTPEVNPPGTGNKNKMSEGGKARATTSLSSAQPNLRDRLSDPLEEAKRLDSEIKKFKEIVDGFGKKFMDETKTWNGLTGPYMLTLAQRCYENNKQELADLMDKMPEMFQKQSQIDYEDDE